MDRFSAFSAIVMVVALCVCAPSPAAVSYTGGAYTQDKRSLAVATVVRRGR